MEENGRKMNDGKKIEMRFIRGKEHAKPKTKNQKTKVKGLIIFFFLVQEERRRKRRTTTTCVPRRLDGSVVCQALGQIDSFYILSGAPHIGRGTPGRGRESFFRQRATTS